MTPVGHPREENGRGLARRSFVRLRHRPVCTAASRWTGFLRRCSLPPPPSLLLNDFSSRNTLVARDFSHRVKSLERNGNKLRARMNHRLYICISHLIFLYTGNAEKGGSRFGRRVGHVFLYIYDASSSSTPIPRHFGHTCRARDGAQVARESCAMWKIKFSNRRKTLSPPRNKNILVSAIEEEWEGALKQAWQLVKQITRSILV